MIILYPTSYVICVLFNFIQIKILIRVHSKLKNIIKFKLKNIFIYYVKIIIKRTNDYLAGPTLLQRYTFSFL